MLGLLLLPYAGMRPARAEPAVCATCHAPQAGELAASIHKSLECQACHGGPKDYDLPERVLAQYAQPSRLDRPRPAFEHGDGFAGKPARTAIPNLCGDCHADIERMNPYGIRTDQLARYWTSGHGKTLKASGDEKVAVCVDCHGSHHVLPAREPVSRTHPRNVPGVCASCHADEALMEPYGLNTAVVKEYHQSVHGMLLLEQGDTGAPTCATCHGNHSATPPGFATVGAVCGSCHQHAAAAFATSIHATLPFHKGCVQCHGGPEGSALHLIERITKPTGVMIRRYAHLLTTHPEPTPEQIREAIHPDPKQIINRAMPTCLDCHEDLEEDESLPKLFDLLDTIAEAERRYVETARRLEQLAQGVLLVERQQFEFVDARTHLIELAPLQHTLDIDKVSAKVEELETVCNQIHVELDELETGLELRRAALIPIGAFALLFAVALYARFRQLKTRYVSDGAVIQDE